MSSPPPLLTCRVLRSPTPSTPYPPPCQSTALHPPNSHPLTPPPATPRPEQVRIAAYLVNGLADGEAATREETLRHMDALGAEYLHFPAYEEEYRTKVLGA